MQENQPNQEPLSKKQQKKLEKEKEKALKKEAHRKSQTEINQTVKEDPLKCNYGDLELCQSQTEKTKQFTEFSQISESMVSQSISVRARLHNSRVKGNLAFLILRDQFVYAQAVAFPSNFVSKQMIKFMGSLPRESVVEIQAEVTKPEQEILNCQVKQELVIQKIFVVSRALQQLPLYIEDAMRKLEEHQLAEDMNSEQQQQKQENENQDKQEENKEIEVTVKMKTRLDNRVLDLRTPAKQAIFRLQSGVCQLFRDFLCKNEFLEIHTPKLISGTSEGGANVFKLDYFGRKACLAQSPQLYKQMAIMADFKKVFEIGPVFRAENSFTHRHLCEFTGLDMEMAINESYEEIMDILGDMFAFIFDQLEKKFARELEVIREQFPSEPFVCKTPVLKFTFKEACQLLKQEMDVSWDENEDFNTETEKKFGKVVKKKFNSDFYFVTKYPVTARPFYTMPCKEDPSVTNSYDFFMRGEEITSGAQRVHDADLLVKNAQKQGIDVNTIQDYIDSFKYGAFPHGGAGIGLERVIMLYCNLRNVRNASMFPRDPQRINP